MLEGQTVVFPPPSEEENIWRPLKRIVSWQNPRFALQLWKNRAAWGSQNKLCPFDNILPIRQFSFSFKISYYSLAVTLWKEEVWGWGGEDDFLVLPLVD
jgi:hypothetical protein